MFQIPPSVDSNTLPHYAGGAAFCYLIVDRVLSFVGKFRGTDSGAKNPDYWKAEIRSGVKEVVEDSGLVKTLQDIRDGILRLIVLTEKR